MRHFINALDMTVAEQDRLFAFADALRQNPRGYSRLLEGRIAASLFFEPSTRTRLSFESAALRLGAQIVGFSDASVSSASKGETIADTIRVVSKYADLAVIRHPKEGAAKVAAQFSEIPVINAGDGGREHPTQTLTDLLAIRSLKGQIGGLRIGCCGDLKFGRTVHSLVRNVSRYDGISFTFVSPEELDIPDFLVSELDAQKIPYEKTRDIREALRHVDILYMTRVQRERFFNEADYLRLKDLYILDAHKLKDARPDMLILHPLPRVNEIAAEVDADPRAKYFEQAECGLYVRMALMSALLKAGGVTL